MLLREAQLADIPQLAVIRFAVTENVLSNPGLVTEADYVEFLTQRGKGWVAVIEGQIVGFAIVDLMGSNVWALFMQPGYDRQGIGRALHDTMLDWYFAQTYETLWLGTTPGTRAEGFYRHAGWHSSGLRPNGEVKFEMTADKWRGFYRVEE
ncbi:GNAT family N-acetyltransferase [Hymenobacter sp. ASUV-10]|uniref:GNAT family N-acetyltransferase n=1 Tax=Hymenobacter aranciens TaxID=3063996 RepID=A0ABT9BIE5_9BACT|nr:GNAT family N-acetyltransferase [Hymenobacter sp. ASUV-10]MDO7877464.1 GNAT family N-acetyltransferase [Hymenobacter sp. ASUV-10]